MRKSDELKQERQSKIDALMALTNKAKNENRNLTDTEVSTFDSLRTEVERMGADIERAVYAERIALEQHRAHAQIVSGTDLDGEDKEKGKMKERFSITKALRAMKARKALDGVEAELNQMGIEEQRAAGVPFDVDHLNIPSYMFRATQQTVSQDSGSYGGALVVSDVPRVQVPFASKLFLEEMGATRLTGLSGGDVPLPVGSLYTYEWLAEGADLTEQKQTFAGPTLSPKRLAAGVPITNRLLMQSSIPVDQYIMNQLIVGYNLKVQTAAINGAGSATEPRGILNTTGVLANTVATDITWKIANDMIGLIQNANATETSLGFLLSPLLAADARSTTRDAGSGRYVMEGNELAGYRALATSLVPTLTGTPNKYPLIFGDFSQLFIGEWGTLSMMIDPYTKLGADSIRIVVNGHVDVAIAQPTAFAKNVVLTIT